MVPERCTGLGAQLLPSPHRPAQRVTEDPCLLCHFLGDRVAGLPMHILPVGIDTQIQT